MMRLLFKVLHATGLWCLLVRCGMLLSRLIPLRNDSGMFFFFPCYHIGGAEKVHADIVACFAELTPWVIFTRKSHNTLYRDLFAKSARLFDLWFLGGLYPLSVGLAAGLVNRHENAVAFGCNNIFYYYLVPYLGDKVRKFDLTHAFDGLERYSLPVAHRLEARVAINAKTVADFAQQYRDHGLDARLMDRVVLIENRVEVAPALNLRPTGRPLQVLYVGRGTVEKRAHLVGRVARLCCGQGATAPFTLVGRGLPEAVVADDHAYCRFTGEIHDAGQLQALYRDADVLLLTSSREGFPLVIMEAMGNGAIPIATNVGGIAVHLRHGHNGFLVDGADEERIVREMSVLLIDLATNVETREQVSQAAYRYACEHFSPEGFCAGYRNLLLPAGAGAGKGRT
ncbi:glycosyltransferase family 4 protein [Geomonas propionica]|uniref:Glycosyltransferase family 4 protein n=1 Tax=Geomonas propionica TaxID=2798582 RepID=A0ABS0YX75_9BACT|nr:glycosyltransferase family 4 protein [Geomonas propionica]MBJ6802448.1 glycosyltransferase family 4 protein [Geomonas propionica]